MFVLAVLIGIYTYCLFFLGILGIITPGTVIAVTIMFLPVILFWKRNLLEIPRISYKRPNKFVLLFAVLFFLQASINIIGALGPELGYDALWYHLTLPKIWLINHKISFISGGLLYYSVMPKLAEMLFVAGLSFGNIITVKLLHFSFGILSCFALYKLQRKFFSPFISLLGVVIFYSNLVVAWESSSAYIDLIRAFFEIMTLWGFINWWQTQQKKWLVISAVMVGLTITTKLLAIGSLFIFSLLIIYYFFRYKKRFIDLFTQLFVYWFVAFLIPLPWFIFSFLYTGNPVYPFFTAIYQVAPEPLNIINFFQEVWKLLIASSDPISPIYLIILPLIIANYLKFKTEIKLVILYSALTIVIWYFTPRTGGGRFMLPYLPALSFVGAAVIDTLLKSKEKYTAYLAKFLVIIIIFLSLFTIAYRFAANMKYFPVIFDKETKAQFLANHLNFSYGDFYDTDGYFKQTIKQTDKILLYGFHNLSYVDFPFVDSSWIKKGDSFNYVATQNTILPERFSKWTLIYQNKKTMVKLYKPPVALCPNTCQF